MEIKSQRRSTKAINDAIYIKQFKLFRNEFSVIIFNIFLKKNFFSMKVAIPRLLTQTIQSNQKLTANLKSVDQLKTRNPYKSNFSVDVCL